jgi:tight adherence protein B
MKRVFALIAVVLLVAGLAASAASAATRSAATKRSARASHAATHATPAPAAPPAPTLRLTRASGAKFPNRAFLLNLSTSTRLTPSQFSVTEGGTAVTGVSIVPASTVGQSHFGTVLLIDDSNSMAGPTIASAIQAARTFVRVRNPQQPVGIIYLSQQPRIIVPMTSNTAALESALATVPKTHAGTHIFDAAEAALQMIVRAHLTQGSIVLLSDGQDTGSRLSEAAFTVDAKARGIAVYTVGAMDPSFTGSTLQSLATDSGGLYTPLNPNDLVPFYQKLGIALSNQYLIRYRSTTPLGESVPVAVKVSGVGSATTTYQTPTLTSGVELTPSHVTHNTFWTSTLGGILITLVCAVLIGLAVHVAISRREGVGARIGSFIRTTTTDIAPAKTLVQRALGDPRQRRLSSPWFVRLSEDLDIAGLQIALRRLWWLVVVATIVLGWALYGATSSVFAAVLALALPVIAYLGIRYLAERQRRMFDEQLPDNLTVIASALRAGHTFVGALRLMLEDAPQPTKRELTRALSDEALGLPLSESLDAVGKRMRSLDFQQVTLVATLQRDTGGNTAEVIDVVTDTIRDRIDLRRLIRTLTAQGRLAGGILSFLPVGILIAVTLIDSNYTHPLFHTTVGVIFLVIGAIMMVTGAIIINRIVNIEI